MPTSEYFRPHFLKNKGSLNKAGKGHLGIFLKSWFFHFTLCLVKGIRQLRGKTISQGTSIQQPLPRTLDDPIYIRIYQEVIYNAIISQHTIFSVRPVSKIRDENIFILLIILVYVNVLNFK